MNESVNLENLRGITNGNIELEKELFDVYIESAEECLKGLETSTGEGQDQEWRTQAHAWKGMSLNLGAETLGKLCADAQFNHTMPHDEKVKMLDAIKAEYENVKEFLRETYGEPSPTT